MNRSGRVQVARTIVLPGRYAENRTSTRRNKHRRTYARAERHVTILLGRRLAIRDGRVGGVVVERASTRRRIRQRRIGGDPLPHVAREVVYAERAAALRVTSDLVRTEPAGLLTVGRVDVRLVGG